MNTALTDNTPKVFEPWNTYDTGAYGVPTVGYGVGQGGWRAIDRCRGDCSRLGLTHRPSRAFRNLFEPLDNGSRISRQPGEFDVAYRLCAAKRKADYLG